MHFFRLFRRRQSLATRAEPGAFSAEDVLTRAATGISQADSDPLAIFDKHQPEEDLRGSGAIFGLIGSRPALEDGAVFRTSARVDTDDLITSLHRQYCQALDNPLGTVSGSDWETPSESSGRSVRGESALPVDPHLHVHLAGQEASIEALLSGAQQFDHAFGPLRESDLGSLPESEPVPEILRLFAPPEYLASAFRWIATLPPTLARREHHSPGIDSPLPMPGVNQTGNSP